MVGTKIKLSNQAIEQALGFRWGSEQDEIGEVYAIILDKFCSVEKYDKYEGACHSTDYVYLSTDSYLIKILENGTNKLENFLRFYGNVRIIKPYLINKIV